MRISLIASFALLLALLAANCALIFRAVTMLRHDQERIAEIQGVRIELAALLNDYVDAETGQRGYVLTGNEDYLVPYNAALKDLGAAHGRLKSLVAPMDQIEELRAGLETVGNVKLAELAQTIQLRREKGFDAAMQLVHTDAGKTSMDKIRTVAAEIDRQQQLAMKLVLLNAEKRKKVSLLISVGSSAILAAAICWLFVITRQNIEERAELLAREHKANEALEKALAAERSAHSEAAHANKLKDEFLAVVSHELRTPLNAITGWTSLLRESTDEGDLKEGLETIEKNARAQARLVDDLLDVSRIITGKLRLQVAPVDLAATAAFVVEGLRPAADARGVRVTLADSSEAMEVAGDADRLQQIIWNLVSNAIKFTPRGGTVEISLSREDSNIALEVKDTGQGITPQFLPRIFDRFSQQDASTTRAHQGLGLGLSISRQLAELHGGRITATSEGAGKGATFRLEIPVLSVHQAAQEGDVIAESPAAIIARETSSKTIKNLRILAVDDQDDTLELVNRVLTRAGAEVRTAETVADAMSILKEWRPDLVISDIGMPEQDGYSFIQGLRSSSDSSLRKMPAIALTAFARDSDRSRALVAGFNDHLAKPVHARALIEKAAEIAGKT